MQAEQTAVPRTIQRSRFLSSCLLDFVAEGRGQFGDVAMSKVFGPSSIPFLQRIDPSLDIHHQR